MTDEYEVRERVEKALRAVQHESGVALPFVLGSEKTVQLRDAVVSEIMRSGDPEVSKLVPSGFISEQIVHGKIGVFERYADGSLRVKLRER
jgi:hypothetical protein